MSCCVLGLIHALISMSRFGSDARSSRLRFSGWPSDGIETAQLYLRIRCSCNQLVDHLAAELAELFESAAVEIGEFVVVQP